MPPIGRRKALAGAAGLLALASPPAKADKPGDTLRVVWTNETPILDTYFSTVPEAIDMSHLLWDRLIERDPDTFEHKPGLATAWNWQSDTAIAFELRRGVKFHDGSDFGADDVVHTFNWMVDPAHNVLYRSNVSWIDHAEKIDDFHVVLHLKQPFPPALDFISMPLAIYPRSYAGPDQLTRNPVGTGPYRIAQIDGTRAYHFVRFDDYYPSSIKGMPAIPRVDVRVIPDEATQLAELLGGRADWVSQITADQVDEIKTRSGFQAFSSPVLRVSFILLDASGRTGAGNPMTDLNFRRALAYGFNKADFVSQLVGGAAQPIVTPCNPLSFGCDVSAAVAYPFNPDRAKQLLSQVSLPKDYVLQLYTSTARPLEWVEAIQQNWQTLGLQVRVTTLPPPEVNARLEKQGLPAFFTDWGGFRINDASAFVSTYFRGSPDDIARDPEVEAWLATADTSTDETIRKTNYAKAIHRITDQAYCIPINSFSLDYAAVRDLSFKGYEDEIPRFYRYKWT